MVRQLNCTISDLKRVIDQFATNGLGYPLYSLPLSQDSSPDTEIEEEVIDPQEEINRILSMSRRPTLMKQAIEKLARDEQKKRSMGPSVAWIPKINEALDKAEAQGRQQAK